LLRFCSLNWGIRLAGEEIINMESILSKISPEWTTLIVAALPVSELRGSIPLAILQFKFVWWKAYIISVMGNMIPVVPWLFFLNYIQEKLMRFKLPRLFFGWLFARTQRKGKLVEEYETIGLMMFVAIPLPITGAWTGAIAAFLFGIKLRHAVLAIFCGVLIAGAIVTILTVLGWIGAIIAGAALIGLAGVSVVEIFKQEKAD